MPTKICAQCSKEFQPCKNNPSQRFCSRQCSGKSRVKESPTFQCAHCGKIVTRRRFRMADGKQLGHDYTTKFCSKECGYLGRKWRPISENGYLVPAGYRRLHKRGGVKLYKHRVVMEKMLGRPLIKGENVHHRDGDRDNADPSNLELWTTKQPPGQRVVDKVAFAIDMLRTYPEFAKTAGVMLVDL